MLTEGRTSVTPCFLIASIILQMLTCRWKKVDIRRPSCPLHDQEVVCRLCNISDNEREIERSISEMQHLGESPAAVEKQVVSSR